jgi:DNA-binding transcriptional LysR family regulator
LDTEVRNAARAPRGRLRLTAPVEYGALRIAPLLARFALEHTGITLETQFSDRLASLIDEGFDAAIRVGVPRDTTLTGRRLGQAGMIVVAARGYLDAHGAPGLPEDLSGHECLLDTNFRDPKVWTFGGDVRASVSGRVSFSSAAACLAAAEAGLGIACLPDFVAEASLAAGRVVRVLDGQEMPAMPIHILFPGGRHQPARLRLLIEFLVRELRAAA